MTLEGPAVGSSRATKSQGPSSWAERVSGVEGRPSEAAEEARG